jgi:prepilin-type N-terminal cleavage/methylation domain-containing protein
MRTKTQLELLRKLRQRKGLSKGFTLIELMITVAIIGLLAGIALPAFIGARAAAQAGARIGELVGQAKECSVFLTSGGVGTAPTTGCTAGSAASYVNTWSPTVSGLTCLNQTASTGVSKASISITSAGVMSCTLT